MFTIEIASVSHRNKLVAEVWFEKDLIAEINQEGPEPQIELFPTKHTMFNFDEYIKVLNEARENLK